MPLTEERQRLNESDLVSQTNCVVVLDSLTKPALLVWFELCADLAQARPACRGGEEPVYHSWGSFL